MHLPFHGFSSPRRAALAGLLALALAGCASLPGRDPLNVQVAGVEPLEGQGLEMRMAVKLRVQNPNDSAVDYDGAALELELNGKRFATGVSNERGSVPRFGETVLTVPVSVSAFSAIRQALGLADRAWTTFPMWSAANCRAACSARRGFRTADNSIYRASRSAQSSCGSSMN